MVLLNRSVTDLRFFSTLGITKPQKQKLEVSTLGRQVKRTVTCTVSTQLLRVSTPTMHSSKRREIQASVS